MIAEAADVVAESKPLVDKLYSGSPGLTKREAVNAVALLGHAADRLQRYLALEQWVAGLDADECVEVPALLARLREAGTDG